MAYLENARHFDPVIPGEQWFFYWKTSAALWEGRIQQFPQHQVIFIPLFWGFHATATGDWDFGQERPECDLLRLVHLLTQYGRKFCWLLPLTPAPFLPNGGVPVTAARTLSISREGVHLGVLDQEKSLNKMFSFFDPRVFQSFTGFLKAFGHFLGQNKIKSPVWGTHFRFLDNHMCVSYFDDASMAFEQGFSRFLKKNFPDGPELSLPSQELELKEKFTREVAGLFSTTAETALGPFWMGVQKITALGGSPRETILRSLPGGKSQLEFTRDLFHLFNHSEWISSSLLTPDERKESLEWILSEHFGSRAIDLCYHFDSLKGALNSEFKPFGVIDLFGGKREHHFRMTGLVPFLDAHFRWLYQGREEITFTSEWIDENAEKVKFFHGADLDRVSFGQVLRLFMMGQKVLLDRAGLGDGLEKKLQIFLLENNIKSQSVNFMTDTQLCELGEGKLIIFDGVRLIENPARTKFWQHIFRYLNLVQPEVKMDDDVFSVWRIRAASTHELSYLDVRRVNIYNPTSYKKLVSIRTQRHFAFMKTIDPTRAQAKSTPEGVEVELLPNGKIALDFGHYEEQR